MLLWLLFFPFPFPFVVFGLAAKGSDLLWGGEVGRCTVWFFFPFPSRCLLSCLVCLFLEGLRAGGMLSVIVPYYHSGGPFCEHLWGRLEYVFPSPEELIGSLCFVCGFSESKSSGANFALLPRLREFHTLF